VASGTESASSLSASSQPTPPVIVQAIPVEVVVQEQIIQRSSEDSERTIADGARLEKEYEGDVAFEIVESY
jgi:hypothetical protein